MTIRRRPDPITPACLACVLATAAHLWHAPLWPLWAYGLCLTPTLAWLWPWFFHARPQVSSVWWRVFLPVLGGVFALAGLRAVWHDQQMLEPSLEGRDVLVVGVVSGLPQRTEDSLRFRLAIESAQWQGQNVRLPAEVLLGWYAGRWGAQEHAQVPRLQAGERWRMVVRLKRPHGQVNPHGFDFELWAWEQGLGANGYVRAGRHDPPPERLARLGVIRWRSGGKRCANASKCASVIRSGLA
ncbi:MAG: DUF4131 domain-containing protein [Betaproteobacteria bacterium]|nr:DUF4131 domain-containing protein [Betaproteobacteria bacterium]